MSLINKEISDFSVQAFHEGAFKKVSKSDVLGKWGVFFFYPADFTFVCPTELEDLANKYEEFKAIGVPEPWIPLLRKMGFNTVAALKEANAKR